MSLARSCNRPKWWLHLVPPSAGTHFSAGPDKPAPPSCFSFSPVGTLVLVPAAWVPTPWSWLLEPYLIPNLTHRKGSAED